MSQLKLIANDESAEDLCELIKALHTEMVEMRAEMQRGFDVLLAVKTDDTETLRKMIVSAPAAVVPFEDETVPAAEPVPALAYCPCCESKEAHTEAQVEELFGYRTMEDGKVRVQSWCRECRGLEAKTNPRKKPTYWSKICPIAQAHNAAVMTSRKKLKKLKAKLETHLSPSERAETESRLLAERQIESKHKGLYNARIAELGYVHPNKAKRAAAKASK